MTQLNTADYLLEAAPPAATALVAGNRRYTYADVRQAAARLAGALAAAGVEASDRVGLLAHNSLFWLASYLGILKLGAIAAPLAPPLPPAELAEQCQLAGCRVICAERRLSQLARPHFSPDLRWIEEDVLSQPGPDLWPAPALIEDDEQEAALMFTSGTTARPRAVRITHRNIHANTDSIITALGLSADERILVLLPFYYCFGTSLLHTHLRLGACLVLASTFVYPELALSTLEAERCTGLAGVPSTFQTLLRNTSFPKRRWPSLRKVQQAGGKLHPVLIQELMAAVPDGEVFVMYGQTEATARLSVLAPADLPAKLGSIGRGLPGVSLQVMGDSGRQVAPGEVGEIIARGDNVSPGYWRDPAATRERFVAGALHTGDLATVDQDGYLYIVDRQADFIKASGFRVSSYQVEACLLELPQVVSAAVVGVPDLVRGEAICAFLTLQAGCHLEPPRAIAHCAQRLARHMVPSVVKIVERMPMNAQGKILKTTLRQMAAQDLPELDQALTPAPLLVKAG